MTRDKATLKLMENLDGAMIAIGHAESVLNKVYKDFESRTCGNCEDCNVVFNGNSNIYYCTYLGQDVNQMFGCYEFERRVE